MKQLLAIVIILVGIAYFNKTPEGVQRVAIITPVTHPSLEQIERGFVETLREDDPTHYQFTTYNAQGNKTLMRSEIEEVARKEYDLVLTIGAQASRMTQEVLTKKGNTTPIVFTSVAQPEALLIKMPPQMTGVSQVMDPKGQLALLNKLKEPVATLLLVYDPTQWGLEEDRQEIQQELTSQGIHLKVIPIFNVNEMRLKVEPHLSGVDAILVLKDNTVIPGVDLLIKLAKRYHTPVFASDLDSVDKGVAIGYGVEEIDYGIEAGKQAVEILHHRLLPSQIPITPVDQFKVKINSQALLEQGGVG